MKTTAFLAFAAFGLCVFSPSFSYADDHKDMDEAEEERVLSPEEAKELIMSTPEADDATSGKVPDTKLKRYYDIRARQLAYRESVKEYRASLEARRKSYSAPQTAAAENYRETIAKLYASESKAAAEERARAENEEKLKAQKGENIKAKLRAKLEENKKKKEGTDDQPVVEEDRVAVNTTDGSDEEVGITEQPIPSDGEVEEGAPKKKVVTSDDAPDFDPANL